LEAVFGVLGKGEDVVAKLWWRATGVGHGFDTTSDTDGDGASEDAISDVLDGLETGRAETVYGVGCGGVWNSYGEGSGADLIGCVGLDDIAKDDIVNEGGVDLGLVESVFEDVENKLVREGIFESTTTGFGEWSTNSGGDDNVVGVLGGDGGDTSGALEVGEDRVETVRHVGGVGF
jgi:hypothetical protein